MEKKTLSRRDFLRMTGTVFAGAAAAACAPATPVVIEKEVIKEVPVEKAVIVEKEVPKEVIKEVPVEKIVEVEKEVIKEVEVEKEVVITATPPAVATITWAFWGNPGEIETNEAVIKAFEEEHPNVKVAVIHAPWSDFFQKIEVMFAGGTGPDVLFGTESDPALCAPGGPAVAELRHPRLSALEVAEVRAALAGLVAAHPRP